MVVDFTEGLVTVVGVMQDMVEKIVLIGSEVKILCSWRGNTLNLKINFFFQPSQFFEWTCKKIFSLTGSIA